MDKHKPARRILAMTLSAVMALSMMPITTMAETPPVGGGGKIIAFEVLSDYHLPENRKL